MHGVKKKLIRILDPLGDDMYGVDPTANIYYYWYQFGQPCNGTPLRLSQDKTIVIYCICSLSLCRHYFVARHVCAQPTGHSNNKSVLLGV